MMGVIGGSFPGSSHYVRIHPCVSKWSNLIFQYQFMVCPPVTVQYFKILRIFHMVRITVYLTRAVQHQRLVRCITTLPGNYRFLTPFPSGKISLMSQARQRRHILARCMILLMVCTSPFVCLSICNIRWCCNCVKWQSHVCMYDIVPMSARMLTFIQT